MLTIPIADWALGSLLLSMRIAPVLGFAPPFTLVRLPAAFRLLLGMGLAGLITAGRPSPFAGAEVTAGWLIAAAVREVFVGAVFVMGLQLMFGALYLAGRTVDVQAGFGLATLIDPTSKAAIPLVGSLLAYAAGAIFFAMDGHLELIGMLAATVDTLPIGTAAPPPSLAHLMAFIASVMTISFGVAGGAILALFVADLAITMLSRTVPQMNVLVFGLQVKTVLLLVVLPMTAGVWGALLARLVRVALEGLPSLLT
jgi:flagellar biosynthetic protein FliR